MRPVVGFVAGALVTLAALPPLLRRRPHLRTNYRGTEMPGALGVVLFLPIAVGTALAADNHAALAIGGGAVVLGVLGFVDDVYGTTHARGLRGHVRALLSGTVTTGAIKALGGVVVGLAAAWAVGERAAWVVCGGAVVALAANLANLLDLRPGRTAKAWLLVCLALMGARPAAGVATATASLAGGVAAFIPYDLRERAMLGDAGANLLGAAAGIAAVATLGHMGQLVCLALLAGLTGLSEAVSFTQVIERVAPLRAIDRLGRKT